MTGRRSIAQLEADYIQLSKDIADLLVDEPTIPVCPLHGADCEVWNA